MREDFTQKRLQLKYALLKRLKQMLAEAEEIHDPIRRAEMQMSIKFRIEEAEKQIDELIRRA